MPNCPIMQEELESGFDRVYRSLVENGPITTLDLTRELGLDASTISRHLKALAATGLASAHREGQRVLYRPERNLYVSMTGPLGPDTMRHGPAWKMIQWRTGQPVDWRFPLITRVPDEGAQATLRRLLEECNDRGLLHPWLKWTTDETFSKWLIEQPTDEQLDLKRLLGRRRLWGDFEFVVFGSCARGDARPDSDLDLLLVGPSPDEWRAHFKKAELSVPPYPSWKDEFQRLVDEVNVGSARHLDVIREEEPHIVDLPKRLLQTIITEGITIYSSTGKNFGIETWRETNGG